MWFTYLVLAQLICNVAISSSKSFGCKDRKISDDWRKAVMDFHNHNRRKLASGRQRTVGRKLMPYAKDMNKLSWDCDLEQAARSQLCDGMELKDTYGVVYNVIIEPNSSQNVTIDIVLEELRYWWKEAKIADLSVDPKYIFLKNDAFGTMAYAKSTRFACTYGSCLIGEVLQCVYDQKPAEDELLYQKAAAPEDICTACSGSTQCVNYLCKSKNPESSTTVYGCNSTAVADRWRKTIVDFHNALRRTVAKGLKYTLDYKMMPPAKDMHELSWDCKLEQIAKSQICSPDGIPPEYDYSYDVITLDPTFITDITVQTRAVLKKATKNAEVVDLSVEPIYHRLIRGYSMMVYGKSTRIGCSMNYCDGRGRLMCVYDKKAKLNELLYEKAINREEICTGCPTSAQCVNYLCQAK
ncbi:hypothetical protein Y032_0610g625 [Ancylostoma ceylanicum]|uniref:SCP domain-containing protein n=1 Tax=Ancylostoma ceylanicum TaxID=53326 RepID=A0A016WLM7_9BILA|nr:hypothetical protein Y032_0610g625 [Ancylostoma ceylanicum]